MVTGKSILQGLDKCLAEEMGIQNLTEKEQALFLLGMRMGTLATYHMQVHKIPPTGSETSYNYMKQSFELLQSGDVWQGEYYLNKLQMLKQDITLV